MKLFKNKIVKYVIKLLILMNLNNVKHVKNIFVQIVILKYNTNLVRIVDNMV